MTCSLAKAGYTLFYLDFKGQHVFRCVCIAGKSYEMFMTGTTSQHLRFHLLNSDATQAVVIGTWYSISQRLDIYVGINYIDPKNAQYNSNGQQVMTFEYFVLLKKMSHLATIHVWQNQPMTFLL